MSLHVNLRWHHLESGLPVWKQTVPWSSAEPRHSSDSGWSILPERSCIWILRQNDANDALHRRGWKGRDFAIGFIHLGWNLGSRAELFCERFVRLVTTLLEPKTLCKALTALTLHWRESRDGAPCAQILERFLASQAEVSCRSASWPGQLGHLGSFNWNFNILIMKNLIRVPSKTHMILAMDGHTPDLFVGSSKRPPYINLGGGLSNIGWNSCETLRVARWRETPFSAMKRNAERFVIFTCGLRRRHDRETSCLPHTSASNDSGLLGIPSSQVPGFFHGFFSMKHFFGVCLFSSEVKKKWTKIPTKKPFPFCNSSFQPQVVKDVPFLFPGQVL